MRCQCIALVLGLSYAQTDIEFVGGGANGLSAWPVGLWSSSEETKRAVTVISGGGDRTCEEVHLAVVQVTQGGGLAAGLAEGAVIDFMQGAAAKLMADEAVDYPSIHGEVASTARIALDVMQILSLAVMAHKRCFRSAARNTLARALEPLQAALQQQVSTMWWMFDIGQYSNSNSPMKHFQALQTTVQNVERIFQELTSSLPALLGDSQVAWGHEGHGMFINSTVIYRRLFPKSAHLDKGLLRTLLRWVAVDSSLADFGALDGQYARWLNDTGLVLAFAFDGIEGVNELTDGIVTQVDLSTPLEIPWRAGFDWVMCLEVAEHIPPSREAQFLENLARHARKGLVLSWAPPEIEGEGHVNCQPLEESKRRVEAYGFVQDKEGTEALRQAAEISWIAASVALYHRRGK
eukprot:4183490-Amphidinium_carterae.1